MTVSDYVPGMWQWDSPQLQVPDLQGGPPDQGAQGQLPPTPPYKSGTGCSHERVFGKTLLHEFLISYIHTKWYLFFSEVQLQVHKVYSERKSRSTSALQNL